MSPKLMFPFTGPLSCERLTLPLIVTVLPTLAGLGFAVSVVIFTTGLAGFFGALMMPRNAVPVLFMTASNSPSRGGCEGGNCRR